MNLHGRVEKIGTALRSHTNDLSTRIPLNKATYVELFFDLVFIFCMRSILPVMTNVPTNVVDWYTYYTFAFTFILMLQIWFNSTIFMNRFGTGGVADIVFLFTNMFLLFVMTRAIGTSWTYYLIYNVCWILIIVNTLIHWVIRYELHASPTREVTRDTFFTVLTLGVQAALIAFSHLFSSVPAQVICLIALLFGFTFWFVGGQDRLSEEGKEHLSERCALLMVLTFGETLIGFGGIVTTDLNLFYPIMYFLLIVGMFLVYLNEIVNLLDLDSLRGGRRYMALTGWMVFCIANVTAAFEMAATGKRLLFMGGDIYFGLSITVYLMSCFLYTPFNKVKYLKAPWIAARAIACLFVMAQSSIVVLTANEFVGQVSLETMQAMMMIVAVGAVYVVLAFDRGVFSRVRNLGFFKKNAAKNEGANDEPSDAFAVARDEQHSELPDAGLQA